MCIRDRLIAHALELPGDVHELRLVAVLHGKDAAAARAGSLEGVACTDQTLEQGVVDVYKRQAFGQLHSLWRFFSLQQV